MSVGIYKIEHLPTGRVYIGSSKYIEKRFKQHLNCLKTNKHHSSKLQFVFNRSSEDYFKFEIVEECKFSDLLEREDFYIQQFDSFKNGFNMTESVYKFWKKYKKYKEEKIREKYDEEYPELKELADTVGCNIYFDIAPSKVKRVRQLLEHYVENCNWEHFYIEIESYRPRVSIRIKRNGKTVDWLNSFKGKIYYESSNVVGKSILEMFYKEEEDKAIKLYKNEELSLVKFDLLER
jgi:group I intron endonuclease